MRKALSLMLVALAVSGTAGCQCCDALMQFEAWKNQTLFGCFHQQPACDPCAQPALAPFGQPMSSPYTSQAIVAPYAGDCCGTTVAAPACQDGCGTPLGGQIITTPGATLAPTPVPMLTPGPETYAPAVR